MRVRLTDQALVAVVLARQHAAAGRREAHVADLVVGLASEPGGAAGRRLGAYTSALAALADRTSSAPPRLPALDVALRWCAGEVGARPAGTVDLLLAALEVGAGDLADLLERCGVPPDDLAATPRPAEATLQEATDSDALSETYALDPQATDVDPAAARAIARTRAVGGGALTLLAALALEAAASPESVPLDPDMVSARLGALPDRGARTVAAVAGDDWDAGVEPVLEAAQRIRDPRRPLGVLDLLRSAALVGGRGATRLLAVDGASGEGRP